jgi:DNA polymerase I
MDGNSGSHPSALLIDGMSVLVRAARAALRAKPMSYQGNITGPLVLFTSTVTSHLGMAPWDYVVVSWEGIPQLNWRREIFHDYKSSRPPRLDDADAVSHDEALAREFCAAAGLCQSWAPEFEGDDIIAAWWRQFRANMPGAQITILSGDRDLLQLCDPATTWRAWQNEVMTDDDVRSVWGVEPERVPLLRALAGDPSDGIPGLPGVGLAKATAVASSPVPPLRVIAALEGEIGASARAQLTGWYAIMELRDPVRRPEIPPIPMALWSPGERGQQMSAFLAKYGLAKMAARQRAGKLPWPPDSE